MEPNNNNRTTRRTDSPVTLPYDAYTMSIDVSRTSVTAPSYPKALLLQKTGKRQSKRRYAIWIKEAPIRRWRAEIG